MIHCHRGIARRRRYFLQSVFLAGLSFAIGCEPVATIEKPSGDLAIEMPDKATPPSEATKATIAVSIDAEGAYWLDGHPVDESDLRTALLYAAQANEETTLIVSKHESAPWEKTVELMVIASESGIGEIKFAPPTSE